MQTESDHHHNSGFTSSHLWTIIASLVVLIAVVGYFAYSRGAAPSDAVARQAEVSQEGSEVLSGLGTYEVYYRQPFAGAPKVQFLSQADLVNNLAIVEERKDGFKFLVTGGMIAGTSVRWRATMAAQAPAR